LPAEVTPLLQRREVKESEVNWLLDLVDQIPGDKDHGNVSLDDSD